MRRIGLLLWLLFLHYFCDGFVQYSSCPSYFKPYNHIVPKNLRINAISSQKSSELKMNYQVDIDPNHKDPDEIWNIPPAHLPVVEYKGSFLDLNSRMLRDRIIMIGQHINDDLANVVVAQLLHLSKESQRDINIYINCHGGLISSAMTIYDVMSSVKCDISTVCYGTASSVGALILAAGTRGRRKAYPNSKIMLHQPTAIVRGQTDDIELQTQEILWQNAMLNAHFAHLTGKTLKRIEKDNDKDYLMNAKEALDYGLIDQVITTRTSAAVKVPSPKKFSLKRNKKINQKRANPFP